MRRGALRLTGAAIAQVKFLRGQPPSAFYPQAARESGLDGSATVDLLINEGGLVVEAQIISESPPDRGFGLAALDTVKTYEFENSTNKLVLLSLLIEFVP